MSTVSDTWVTEWLTPGRYNKYLKAAGHDPVRALELYEWNARVSSALLHDLGHLEVGLRNAYDRQLLAHPLAAGQDWISRAIYDQLWAPHLVVGADGNTQDKNSTPRGAIKTARKYAGYTDGGSVNRGKVIAEIMFGFWTYLTDSLHEKTLWVPSLRFAYAPGADRAQLHDALSLLRDARNRLAHNESIFDQRPENLRRRIIFVARTLSAPLSQHIAANSDVPVLLAAKP
ncbi:Abi family protein [Brachybacterium sp. AOP42-C2-15]|uniref:Abi family protein n=1 Tax=Brachybacterium TaxID=43668 RepID=UPI000DF3CF9E|nr:Abi family protein [Brachybacterium alimentarium]RCS89074.1 CAAX protease [Brachybacterium alimentarium]